MRFVSTTTRDPGFVYPNAPDTMDLGTVLVRSLSGHAVDEQGNVLLHHERRKDINRTRREADRNDVGGPG